MLSALIARAVWEDDEILNLDLTSYIEPLKTKVNDEEDSEDNEDGSSEDKEMEGESNVKCKDIFVYYLFIYPILYYLLF